MTILHALIPIFVIILFGYGLKASGFPGDDFWEPAKRITYYILFPSLLFHNLSTAQLGDYPLFQMSMAVGGAILILTALVLFLKEKIGADNPSFTSIIQGSIRMNTYLGISAAASLFGQEGITLAALNLAIIIPLVNVVCVAVLTHYTEDQSPKSPVQSILQTSRSLLTNPLILACSAGILFNALDMSLPVSLHEIFKILGRASLPLGLLAVGSGLNFSSMHSTKRLVLLTSSFKLLCLPAITTMTCLLLGIEGKTLAVAILFSALPASPSSYILAHQMGGNQQLMASILTVEIALSALSLSVILSMLV
ncbi:MAG: AEC family transporter [SAR324 cluster bacterium]|nr:AEC family transporter [SAR324 cluster bacterium]